jgi:hypothetical protein
MKGRQQGLTGYDLTSFALLHVVADVLMLSSVTGRAPTPIPVRTKGASGRPGAR